jgi:hypothetical protein
MRWQDQTILADWTIDTGRFEYITKLHAQLSAKSLNFLVKQLNFENACVKCFHIRRLKELSDKIPTHSQRAGAMSVTMATDQVLNKAWTFYS